MSIEEIVHYQEFSDVYQKILVNVYYTSSWISQRDADFLRQFDLTSQQYNILRILKAEHPNRISIKAIKHRMLDKMSDVSRLIERMRKKGLVERIQSDTDRRAVEIAIAGKGLGILYEISQVIDTHRNLGLQNLSQEEAEVLNKLLDKIRS